MQLSLIAVRGEICFTETNTVVLYSEIGVTAIVVIFAIVVFVMQYRRLNEKRASDGRRN
ncbi:MAG: hypothetical protein QUS33_13545 [Dehalococcoidia bacterium]|nr:hypothetical protein [Dehalococcoidia bacterium]